MSTIITAKETNESKRLSRLCQEGKLRRIYAGLYTDDLHNPMEVIIDANWLHIITHIVPEGILSHRSAHDLKPTPFKNQNKLLFMTSNYTRTILLPGLTIKVIKGNNHDFTQQVTPYVARSNPARMLLENCAKVRGKAYHHVKTIGIEGVEKYCIQVMRLRGENGLNQLRDEAKNIASKLKLSYEFQQLNKMISALLSTNTQSYHLNTEEGRAIAKNEPFDYKRILLFEKLSLFLQKSHLALRPLNYAKTAFKNVSFFEAYFSNYIEGTEFLIDEAEDIVFQGHEINNRHADSQDILANFTLTNDYMEMSITPRTDTELLEILCQRHAYIMRERPEKRPGKFKDKNNRAGNTVFVDKKEVIGTLKRAFPYYQQLEIGLARALFLHYILCEVHPFCDGNGRISRIMMNAELVSAEQCKIMIPTVHRDNYLNGLRLASRDQDFTIYCKSLDQAHAYTASVEWSDYQRVREKIERDCADKLPDDGLPIFNRSLRQLTLSDFGNR